MGRQLGYEECVIGFACCLTYRVCRPRKAGAERQRALSLEIGQLKVIGPIASVESTDKREQSLVLADRQGLTVACGPALGREAVGKRLNLS